jgi:hypothetical protein
MKNILVVERLNVLSLFVVIYFRLKKSEIYIYEYPVSPYKRWWLRFLSLQECSFETCVNIDSGSIFGREGDSIDKVVDEFIDNQTLEVFKQFFANIKDLDGKLRLLIKRYVLYRCEKLNKISIWINGSFQKKSEQPYKVYLMGNICRIKESFILKQCYDHNVIPIFSSNIFLIFDIISKIFRKLLGITFAFFKITKNNKMDDASLMSIMSSNIDKSSYVVLYFPHQSIFYGDMFKKDYFYSKDKNSVFHPSNILHVEFSNIFLNRERSKFYDESDIKTVLFPKSNIIEFYRNFNYVIGTLGLTNTLFLLKKNFTLFCVLLFKTIQYLFARNVIKDFSNVKVVLVGYEILFPPIVSLAFESIKVRTVATQERFMVPAFYSNFGFILDSYFCDSEFVSDKVKESRNKFVNIYTPCGQPRTDMLVNLQKKNTQNNDKFMIVAFDYHSTEDVHLNKHEPIINWRANNSFYHDLCRLSEQLPYVEIVIRGKNINWTKNVFFRDVLMRINNNPNIQISSIFSVLNEQYRLAVKADLIIAKHTSIGDELIATGKNVIFYDFLPNSSKVISREYDYDKADIFVHSYDELELKTKSVVNGDNLLTEPKLIGLQKIINNGPADGKVKARIMSNLDALYIEANA